MPGEYFFMEKRLQVGSVDVVFFNCNSSQYIFWSSKAKLSKP